MKLNKLDTDAGICIPPAAMRLAKLDPGEPVEYHVHDGVIVTLRPRMTAAQMIDAACALHELFARLSSQLADACGRCTDCLDVCPFKPAAEAGAVLPDIVRQEVDIPADTPVYISIDEEAKSVMVSPTSLSALENVPAEFLDMLEADDVCLGALDQLLVDGGAIYGG